MRFSRIKKRYSKLSNLFYFILFSKCKFNISSSGLHENSHKTVLPLKHEILSEYLARNNIEGGCFAPRNYKVKLTLKKTTKNLHNVVLKALQLFLLRITETVLNIFKGFCSQLHRNKSNVLKHTSNFCVKRLIASKHAENLSLTVL